MNSMIVAFNVVFPLLILMALGYYVKHIGLIHETSLLEFNKIVFKFLLPCSLFKNIVGIDLQSEFDIQLILISILIILIVCLGTSLISKHITKDPGKQAIIIMDSFRANSVLLGLVICESIYGAGNVGICSIILAFVVPIYNVLSVIVLSLKKSDKSIDALEIFVSIFKNPLIISALCALTILYFDIRLPLFITDSVNYLAKIATPLALIILGGTFNVTGLKENRKLIVIITFLRLIAVPMFACGLAYILGYRAKELASIMVIFASPCAVSSFSMAEEMGGDSDLASAALVVTTVVSTITLFLWIFIFDYCALF